MLLLKCAPGGRTLANPAPAWMPSLRVKGSPLHLKCGVHGLQQGARQTHLQDHTFPSRAPLPIPTAPHGLLWKGLIFLHVIAQGRHLGCDTLIWLILRASLLLGQGPNTSPQVEPKVTCRPSWRGTPETFILRSLPPWPTRVSTQRLSFHYCFLGVVTLKPVSMAINQKNETP